MHQGGVSHFTVNLHGERGLSMRTGRVLGERRLNPALIADDRQHGDGRRRNGLARNGLARNGLGACGDGQTSCGWVLVIAVGIYVCCVYVSVDVCRVVAMILLHTPASLKDGCVDTSYPSTGMIIKHSLQRCEWIYKAGRQ